MVALCERLQACPALEELSLSEYEEEEDRDGATKCLCRGSQAASLLCSLLVHAFIISFFDLVCRG
jgi:hypothetical protein